MDCSYNTKSPEKSGSDTGNECGVHAIILDDLGRLFAISVSSGHGHVIISILSYMSIPHNVAVNGGMTTCFHPTEGPGKDGTTREKYEFEATIGLTRLKSISVVV